MIIMIIVVMIVMMINHQELAGCLRGGQWLDWPSGERKGGGPARGMYGFDIRQIFKYLYTCKSLFIYRSM